MEELDPEQDAMCQIRKKNGGQISCWIMQKFASLRHLASCTYRLFFAAWFQVPAGHFLSYNVIRM
jgi:hypothetical protein